MKRKEYLNVKRLDIWDGIPAPPLFIEEVSAQPTEEFINFRFSDFRLNDFNRTSNILSITESTIIESLNY